MAKELDKKFMRMSLVEAEKAYCEHNLPIGAVLVINNELVGVGSNTQSTKKDWFHHAENILIQMHGGKIRQARKASKNIELFTTIEPCLMCLGAAAHNRITRIIYACPDPVAGSSHIKPPTKWYEEKWPVIEQGHFKKECYEVFMKHIEENPETWSNHISEYRDLRKYL